MKVFVFVCVCVHVCVCTLNLLDGACSLPHDSTMLLVNSWDFSKPDYWRKRGEEKKGKMEREDIWKRGIVNEEEMNNILSLPMQTHCY